MYDRFVNSVYDGVQLQILCMTSLLTSIVECIVYVSVEISLLTLYSIMIQLQIVMFDKSVDFHNRVNLKVILRMISD